MSASNDDSEVFTREKDVTWYQDGLPDVPEPTREVLENYSHIPTDQIAEHCAKLRDLAWQVYPYPCIGTYRFLDLSISLLPAYDDILRRLKGGQETFLDLGCCFGQDIRRLVYDGVPSDKTYGSDLQLGFMDLGYDLFLDKDTLKTTFIAGDVFDDKSDLHQLDGKVDVLQASAFFHLFDRPKQKQIAYCVIKLLKPQKGSILVGQQLGSAAPGDYPSPTNPANHMFKHDPDTWRQLWEEVGEETGTKWEIQAIKRDLNGHGAKKMPMDVKWLLFSVKRL